MYYDPEMMIYEPETTMVWDPVCGISFEAEDALATSEYQGETFYFCSAGCKEEFDEFPEGYTDTD